MARVTSRGQVRSRWLWAGLLLGLGMIIFSVAGLWQVWHDSFEPRPPSQSGPRIGEPALDFTTTTLAGKPIRLSDYHGQVVLLNFWATWCPPCIAELPDLEALYRDNRDRGLVILAVNMQEDPALVRQFVQEHGLTLPVVMDPDSRITLAYRVRSLPMSWFIDKDGVVRNVALGQLSPQRMRDAIGPLLK